MGARAVWGSNGKGPRNVRELNVAVNTSQRISILDPPPPSLSIAYRTLPHAAPNTASPHAPAAMRIASHVAGRDLSSRSAKVGAYLNNFLIAPGIPQANAVSSLQPYDFTPLGIGSAAPAQVSDRGGLGRTGQSQHCSAGLSNSVAPGQRGLACSSDHNRLLTHHDCSTNPLGLHPSTSFSHYT
jgi:hypothetical protein